MRRTVLLLAGLSCLTLPLRPAISYSSIDGAHLKPYVDDLAAMSRRYRDNGHPQFWGRIIGTEADAENGRWLLDNSRPLACPTFASSPSTCRRSGCRSPGA